VPAGIPLRHELKYYINDAQYLVLSNILDHVLSRDPFGDEANEYHIRSLYFDDVFQRAFFDKINGVANRKKYRIRIYNLKDDNIRLECKTKVGNLISKRSVAIPPDLCEQLTAADPTNLDTSRSGLLAELFTEMRVNLLRPVVLVDYIREAYTHQAEEIRITFDKQLRTGFLHTDLFDPDVPMLPPLENESIILEIKYNKTLPSYIRDVLWTYCSNALPSAISKYVLCRTFEDLSPDPNTV